jgi:hypothetical protein
MITDGEIRTLKTKLLGPKASASTNFATSVIIFNLIKF